jgi:hypothetical protein
VALSHQSSRLPCCTKAYETASRRVVPTVPIALHHQRVSISLDQGVPSSNRYALSSDKILLTYIGLKI